MPVAGADEGPGAAAVRETREETGHTVVPATHHNLDEANRSRPSPSPSHPFPDFVGPQLLFSVQSAAGRGLEQLSDPRRSMRRPPSHPQFRSPREACGGFRVLGAPLTQLWRPNLPSQSPHAMSLLFRRLVIGPHRIKEVMIISALRSPLSFLTPSALGVL